MKNFIYVLFLLSILNYSAESAHKYGSLLWDHDNYIERVYPVRDTAMGYIKDLNHRIETALDDGNILRAHYLSDLLLGLLTTGGSYGFRQGQNSGPTPEELHDINKSMALTARSFQVKAKEFPRAWDTHPREVEELEYTIYDKFENLDGHAILAAGKANDYRITDHTDLLKDLFVAHLQEGKINIPSNIRSSREYEIMEEIRAQPTLTFSDFGPIPSPLQSNPDRVRPLMGQEDKNYTAALFKKPVVLKTFYEPRCDKINQIALTVEPIVVENQNIIIYDFIRDKKFLLAYTPADNHCWLHAVSCDNTYFVGSFLEDLLTLNDEDRKKAARFMAEDFLGKFISNSTQYPETVRKKLSYFKEFYENLGKDEYVTFDPLNILPQYKFLNIDTFIDVISQKDVFDVFVTKDLSKEGHDLWKPLPEKGNYGGLYALLNRKNVVTVEFAAYKTQERPKPYIYLTTKHLFLNENNDYVYCFSGNSHAGTLLPLPLKDEVKSANKEFFKTWYSATKNFNHEELSPSSNP